MREYIGGYDDWLRQRTDTEVVDIKQKPATTTEKGKADVSSSASGKRRLAYHEKRELESLPATIESLDAKLAELHEVMARPEFYKQPPTEIARQQAETKRLQQDLDAAYARWEELEQIAG